MKKGTRRIPLTQGKYAIVDSIDYDWLMQWNWHVLTARAQLCEDRYYATRRPDVNGKRKSFYMHREIGKRMGFSNHLHCDHINHDGLDNTRANLRQCTPSQNHGNRRKYSTSVGKGVGWHDKAKKWRARIKLNGKEMHLGLYSSLRDARSVYAEAAKSYFGEFACLM